MSQEFFLHTTRFSKIAAVFILCALPLSFASECFYVESAAKFMLKGLIILWVCFLAAGVLYFYVLRRNTTATDAVKQEICLSGWISRRLKVLIALFFISQLLASLSAIFFVSDENFVEQLFQPCLIITLLSMGFFVDRSLLRRLCICMQALFVLLLSLELPIFLNRISFLMIDGDHLAFKLGNYGGRFWGLLNPNIEGLFCLAALLAALYLYMQLHLLKSSSQEDCTAPKVTNGMRVKGGILITLIFLELIVLLAQQSRGCLLALLVATCMGALLLYRYGSPARWRQGASQCLDTSQYCGVQEDLGANGVKGAKIALFCMGFIVCVGLLGLAVNTFHARYLNQGVKHVYTMGLQGRQLSQVQDMNQAASELRENIEDQAQEKMALRFTETLSTGRIDLWKQGLVMINSRPLLGYGPFIPVELYAKYFSQEQIEQSLLGGSLHNQYLSLALCSGFCGLLSFLALCVHCLRTMVYSLKAQCGTQAFLAEGEELQFYQKETLWFVILSGSFLCALMVNALVESLLLYRMNPIAFIFWLLMIGLAVQSEYSCNGRPQRA